MKHFLLVPVLSGLVLTVSAQFNQYEQTGTTVFESGFEEGNKSIWDDYDGNPDSENKIIADPGPFGKAGNHVMQFRVPQGQRGGADLVKILPDQYDSLYVRWYQKYETGFNFDAPNHGGGLFAGSRDFLGQSDFRPDGDDFASSTLEYNTQLHTPQLYVYYRGMYQDCANPDGACWGDHLPCTSDEGGGYCTVSADRDPPLPPVLVAGTWYCFDMMMKMGNPTANGAEGDGELAFWVNGVLAGHWKNRWMRTTSDLKLSILWLSLFHHDESHSAQGILIDDVSVSTLRLPLTTRNDEFQRENGVFFFPNPSFGSIQIAVSDNRAYSVTLTDITGRMVMNTIETGKMIHLDTSHLVRGMYLLSIQSVPEASVTFTGKVILGSPIHYL